MDRSKFLFRVVSVNLENVNDQGFYEEGKGTEGEGRTPVRMIVPAGRVVPCERNDIILGMLKIKSLEIPGRRGVSLVQLYGALQVLALRRS